MKNLLTFCLSLSLLVFGGLACKTNPLAKYTKQYNCTIEGEREPQTSEEYFIRAQKHIEIYSGNGAASLDDCAFAALNEAIRLDPNNTDALRVRGYGYYQRKQDDLASADYNKVIQIEPNNPRNYFVRRYFYENTGLIDKAIEDQTAILNLLLKNNPADNTELIKEFEKRAELYEKQEDYENAIKDYSEAIRIEPDSYILFYQRAKAFEKKGEFENAAKDYTEAIRLSPEFEHYYYNRAEVYLKLGKNDLAEADMKKFYELIAAKEGKTNSSTVNPAQNPSSTKTISGGILNGKAINLVQPAYPMAAKAVRASGAVHVLVTIDEEGNVISASPVSGHPLLRSSSVQAARASKFSPTLLSGKSVKVTGVIVYNFVP
jgi:TonB family protein